ncbi:hypothetical protein AB6A40_000093 [Gnathostoma spinigerum]|uniref:Uncharacterized protein n=1 Tax=Gnathostoma spinigerum TaxID=75299 RepID=A0ABD6E7N0_9BILA
MMISIIILALLVNQTIASIFMPVHGYGKTKRSTDALIALICQRALMADVPYDPFEMTRNFDDDSIRLLCERYIRSI